MDTGAAGHAMPAEMFPRVELDRTSTAKKFVAANGENIKGEKTILFKSRGRSAQVHKFQKRKRCEALDLNEKGRASWQCHGV